MGDISEMRAVIVILAFVVFTVTLVGLMVSESPSMFMGIAQGSSGTGTDQTTSPSSLLAWNSTYILNITGTFEYEFHVGGWNVRVEKWDNHWSTDGFFMETYDAWWIFNWNFDQFKWFKEGTDVSIFAEIPPAPSQWRIPISRLDLDFANGKSLTYQAKNTKTQWDISFNFNSSKFAKPSDALYGNEMYMFFELDFNDRSTSINALSFIGGIFTFSLPGLPFIPNLILWLMIFPAAMYLVFIFVLRIIGAVFGGGGA